MMKEKNDYVFIDSRGYLSDEQLRACRAEAIGVYMVIMLKPGSCLSLADDEKYAPQLPKPSLQGRLRVFADYLNEHYPTKDPYQVYRGLRDLHDHGIIEIDGHTLRIAAEHNYVKESE
jgi:hypothetical protein